MVVTFDGPYPGDDLNNHNALTTIGPALRAIRAANRVRTSIGLYRALKARGAVEHHDPLAAVDWAPYRRWRWKTGAAANQDRDP